MQSISTVGLDIGNALRSRRRGHEAVLFAFDLIEHDGDDLRDQPLIERKRRLKKLLGRAKRRAIQFVEHLEGDGPTVFRHVCRMNLEGVVSKRTDAPYRSLGHRRRGSSRRTRREAVRREPAAATRGRRRRAGHAENDSRDPGYFDDGSPSWVKWHAPLFVHPSNRFDLDHAVRREREEEWR